MNSPWFKRAGILFIPSSLIGWLIFFTGITYSVYVFINIDCRSHSISDTLMNFISNLTIIGVIYFAIAFFTSRKNKAK